MGWNELAKAIVDRRVQRGHLTRQAFAAASGISIRTLGDLESARRDSYAAGTLARLEQALDWPSGRVEQLVDEHPNGAVAFPSEGADPPGLPIPGPIAELLEEYRQAARPERDALLEQVRRIAEWARYRRER